MLGALRPYAVSAAEKTIDLSEKVEYWSARISRISIFSYLLLSTSTALISLISEEPVVPCMWKILMKRKWLGLIIPPNLTIEQSQEISRTLAVSPVCRSLLLPCFIPYLIAMIAVPIFICSSTIKCVASLCIGRKISWTNWKYLLLRRT